MGRSRQTIGLMRTSVVLVAAMMAAGCASIRPPAVHTAGMLSGPEASPLDLPPDSTSPTATGNPAYPTGPRPAAATAGPTSGQMQDVIAEVQQLGTLDPAAREQLLEDLKQTDPSLWPLMVRQVRANLAWQRQAEERELAAARGDVARPGSSPWPSSRMGQPPQDDPQLAVGARPAAESGGSPSDGGPVRGSPWPPCPAPLEAIAPETHKPRPDRFAPAQSARDIAEPRGEERAPAERLAQSHAAEAQPQDKPQEKPWPPVTRASYTANSADPSWQSHVSEAIRKLESDLRPTPQSEGELARHARLRMLYLIAGRRDDALRPTPSLDPGMQEFWSEELYGLATLLDTELISDGSRRKAEAKQHLSGAVTRLGESCPLVVRNLAFVTVIDGFGNYKPFDKYEFQPGQQVLLYAELENFKTKETPRGYHTATRSSYQIFDSSGRRVAEHEFKPSEEYCPSPRRDYYISYLFRMPKQIFPGKHVLQLTVADLNSEKIGQSLIDFAVKAADN